MSVLAALPASSIMYSIVVLAILGSVLTFGFKVFKVYRRYTADWDKAKKTGLVCIPGRKYKNRSLRFEL